jgi:hypothetical protein
MTLQELLAGPASLERAARRQIDAAAPKPDGSGWSSRARTALRKDWVLAAVLLVGAAIVGVAVPECWLPAVLVDSSAAPGALGTFMQVEATAVALSAAVVTFAAQTFAGTRFASSGLSLVEFARESGMLRAVRLGLMAVAVDGVVLLAFRGGEAGGRAGLAAALLSGVGLAWVLALLVGALRALSPAEQLRRRTERLEGAIVQTVKRAALVTAANDRLAQARTVLFLPEALPHRLEDEADAIVVRAHATGTVRDIDLHRLARAVHEHEQPARTARLSVLVELDKEISAGDPFLAVPRRSDGWPPPDASKILTIGSAVPLPDLAEDLGRLHQEALDAIRTDDRGLLDGVLDTYERLLARLPAAWADRGFRFTREQLDNTRGAGELFEHVVEQAAAMANADRTAMASALLERLYRIGLRAADEAGAEICRRVIGVLRDISDAIMSARRTRATERMRRDVPDAIVDLTRAVSAPLRDS